MDNPKDRKKTIREAVKVGRAGSIFLKPTQKKIPEFELQLHKEPLTEKIPEKTSSLESVFFQTAFPIPFEEEAPREFSEASLEEVLSRIHQDVSEEHSIVRSNKRCQDTQEMVSLIKESRIKKPGGDPFSTKDQKELDAVLRHREHLLHFREALDALLTEKEAAIPLLVAEISHGIDTQEMEGFSIPWSIGPYQACFEFKKGPNNYYYFIIHNRGQGIEDESLHGKVRVQDNGRLIGKTSVMLLGTKESIVQETFLQGLLQIYCTSGNLTDAYALIKKHLLEEGKCTLQTSMLEEKTTRVIKELASNQLTAEKLQAARTVLKNLTTELLKHDLSFDTIHRNASSMTLPEKWLASPEVLKYLALYSSLHRASPKTFLERAVFLNAADPEVLNRHLWKWKKNSETSVR